MRRAVGVGGLEVGERGGEGTEECLMRGHLAFLSMFNAVCHVGHQGLSRYCTTGSSSEPVTITAPYGGKCAPRLTRVALHYSVSWIHSSRIVLKLFLRGARMPLVRAKVRSVAAWKYIRKSDLCSETVACTAGL